MIFAKLFGVFLLISLGNSSCRFEKYAKMRLVNLSVIYSTKVSSAAKCKQICQRRNAGNGGCHAVNVYSGTMLGIKCDVIQNLPSDFMTHLSDDKNGAVFVVQGRVNMLGRTYVCCYAHKINCWCIPWLLIPVCVTFIFIEVTCS
jgi:hypothetical protein